MDRLGVFHANQTSVSWSTSELRVRLALWKRFKPSSKIILLTVPIWIICVINVLCLSCFRVCSLLPCGHLLRKGWPLGSRLWCLIVFFALSRVVSWVRCVTWMYRFLILVAFLTSKSLSLCYSSKDIHVIKVYVRLAYWATQPYEIPIYYTVSVHQILMFTYFQ